MLRDIEIAAEVARRIADQPFESFMQRLIQDANRIDEQLLKYQSELQSLFTDYSEQANAFQIRISESRGVLETIQDESDNPKTEHWMLLSFRFVDSLERTTFAIQRVLLNGELTVFSLMTRLYSSAGVLQKGTFSPSSVERWQYVKKLVKNLLGFVPGIGEVVSLVAIGKTIREWQNHKLKFDIALQRTAKLIEYNALVDWLMQEGLSSTEELITQWKKEAGEFGPALSELDYHLRDWFSNIADRDPRVRDLLAGWDASKS